jgi:hypothetical protein
MGALASVLGVCPQVAQARVNCVGNDVVEGIDVLLCDRCITCVVKKADFVLVGVANNEVYFSSKVDPLG